MHCIDNIDNELEYHEQIIRVCDEYPHDEEMLVLKAKSLKHLKKNYKSLECIEKILKINPNNRDAIFEIISYIKE